MIEITKTNFWDAAGAIGQILGAFATLWAVRIALRIDKGKLILTVKTQEATSYSPLLLSLHAVNTGRGIMKLNKFGIRHESKEVEDYYPDLNIRWPFVLSTSEDMEISVQVKTISIYLQRFNLIGQQKIRLFLVDSYNQKHFSELITIVVQI